MIIIVAVMLCQFTQEPKCADNYFPTNCAKYPTEPMKCCPTNRSFEYCNECINHVVNVNCPNHVYYVYAYILSTITIIIIYGLIIQCRMKIVAQQSPDNNYIRLDIKN
jgi:hypothetical protein